MDAVGGLRAAAEVAAFAAMALLFPQFIAGLRRAKAVSRADVAAPARLGFAARILRNGAGPATAAARALSAWRPAGEYLRRLAWFARQQGFETDAHRVGGVLIVAMAAAFPLGWAASSSPVFGALLPVCLAMGLGMAAKQAHERQVESMREAVPDMLHTMSACFHAGYSLLQCFDHLARESRGPLRRLFLRAHGDLETGCTAEEALRRMRGESALPELSFVTAALEIQHRTGGSMQKILDSACESIEGELALRRSLRVQTAQARLSMRIVTIMPFVLMAVFSLLSPGFLAPFFSSALGVAVFLAAMGMQAAGVLAVRRMLDVREA